jgi:hypothetical protein
MLPAKAVRKVRVFFVIRLFKLRARAVRNDIEVFLGLLAFFLPFPAGSISISFSEYGFESLITDPSSSFIILLAYLSARSGLCVTIITSLSLAISFSISIICTLVSESSAPVGSSARTISGSFTRARAIATLCICPPESWLGFLYIWS